MGRWLLILCAGAFAACTPHVARNSLTANPEPVCYGGRTFVQVQFNNGFLASKTLTTDVPGDSSYTIRDSGVMLDRVVKTMTIFVNAKRLFWKADQGQKVVHVWPHDTTRLVPFKLREVPNSGDSLVTSDTLDWAPGARIESISNVTGVTATHPGAWPLRLTHGGVTVILPDTTSTLALRGITSRGVWDTRLPPTQSGVTRHPGGVQLMVRLICDSVNAHL